MTLNYDLYIISLLSIVAYEWKESYFVNISIEPQKLLKLVVGKEYIITLKTKRKVWETKNTAESFYVEIILTK